MKYPIFNLHASSPEELNKVIMELNGELSQNSHITILNLYGPQILVRQFDLPRLPPREIKNALKLEAAEIFSLLPEEIEIDYQMLDVSEGNKIRGVFTALPKSIFDEYVNLLNKVNLAPEKVTANIFSRINYFLHGNGVEMNNFYLIDFFKEGIANLVLFNNGTCELLREINCENTNDAVKEISHSLKYALCKSACKKFNNIFVMGELSNKGELISSLERELNINIKKYNLNEQTNSNFNNSPFDINLTKSHIFPNSIQKKILSVINIILTLSISLFLLFTAATIAQYTKLRSELSSLNKTDYDYAKGLFDKINVKK